MYKLNMVEKTKPTITPFFIVHTLNMTKIGMQTYNLYQFPSSSLQELNQYLVEINKLNNLIKNKNLDIDNDKNIVTDFKNYNNRISVGYLTQDRKIVPFSSKLISIKEGYDIDPLEIKVITYTDQHNVEFNVEFNLLSEIIQDF